jgi:hypothetical protein
MCGDERDLHGVHNQLTRFCFPNNLLVGGVEWPDT